MLSHHHSISARKKFIKFCVPTVPAPHQHQHHLYVVDYDNIDSVTAQWQYPVVVPNGRNRYQTNAATTIVGPSRQIGAGST